MQLQRTVAPRVGRTTGSTPRTLLPVVPRSVGTRASLSDKLPVDASAVVGERVGKWLGTVYDALSFPARLGVGAALSFPERVQGLQQDVQRFVELVQDPRTVQEKEDVLRKEVESTVVEFLEKGATVEQDVIANLKTVLPAEAAQYLSEWIPKPPSDGEQEGPVVTVSPSDVTSAAPTVTYSSSDVAAKQIESEITEIRTAVAGLKSALEAMRTNTDAASVGMLKLTLREARDQLARRVNEASTGTAQDPALMSATMDARQLLDEVNAAFLL